MFQPRFCLQVSERAGCVTGRKRDGTIVCRMPAAHCLVVTVVGKMRVAYCFAPSVVCRMRAAYCMLLSTVVGRVGVRSCNYCRAVVVLWVVNKVFVLNIGLGLRGTSEANGACTNSPVYTGYIYVRA